MTEKSRDAESIRILRAWDRIQKVKRQLIREGSVNADASVPDVLGKIKQLIPPELIPEK